MRLAAPNRVLLFALLALLTPFDVFQTAIAQTDLDWLQTQPEGGSIHLLHMPAWDSTTVFASVEARGIWSFDLESGQWTMRNDGIPPAYNVYTLRTSEYLVPYPDAFASSPAIPGKLWCLYSSVGIIYEYNDTTETWSQYSENVPRAGDTPWLHIDDENPDLVFLSGVVPPQWRTPEDVVYVSYDRGFTWSSIDTLVSGPILELRHSVPGRLVIGDYYSDDGGQKWTKHFEYSDGSYTFTIVQLAEDPKDGTVWAIAQELNGSGPVSGNLRLMHSTDACSSWVETNTLGGYARLSPNALVVAAEQSIWCATSGYDLRVSFNEGGTFVTPQVSDSRTLVEGIGFTRALLPLPNNGIFLGNTGGAWKSIDSDTVFTGCNRGLEAVFVGSYLPESIKGTDSTGDTVYVTALGNLYRTIDAGLTWQTITHCGGPSTYFELQKANPLRVYLWERYDTPQVTYFMMASFDPDDPTSPNLEYHSGPDLSQYVVTHLDATVDPFIKDRIYLMHTAAFEEFTRLLVSEDKGETWETIFQSATDADHDYTSVHVDPDIPGLVYLLGDSLAYSRDYGATWFSCDPLDSPGSISAVFFPEAPNLIVTLEQFAGISISEDGGETFSVVSSFGMQEDEEKTGIQLLRVPGVNPRRVLFDGSDRTSWLTHAVLPDTGEWLREPVSDEFISDGEVYLTDKYWYCPGEIGILRRNAVYSSAVESDPAIPNLFYVSDPYPNPFNSSIRLTLTIPNHQPVHVDVYNTLGRHVQSLHSSTMTPGSYNMIWNAKRYPSGTYFIRVDTPQGSIAKRIVLVR